MLKSLMFEKLLIVQQDEHDFNEVSCSDFFFCTLTNGFGRRGGHALRGSDSARASIVFTSGLYLRSTSSITGPHTGCRDMYVAGVPVNANCRWHIDPLLQPEPCVGSSPIALLSYYGSQHYVTNANVRTGTRKAEVALVGGYEVIKK